jgi:hypothetical protein
LCISRSRRRLDAASLTDANGLKAWTTGSTTFSTPSQSSKFKVQSSRFKVQSSEFRVHGSTFTVQKFKVQGSKLRVRDAPGAHGIVMRNRGHRLHVSLVGGNGILTPCQYSSRFFPSICGGRLRPMRNRTVGATSARTPPARIRQSRNFLLLPTTTTIGTG